MLSPSESDLQIGVASNLNLLTCSLVGKWPTTLVKQMFLSEMLPSAWFLKPMWSMELITKAVNDIFSIYQTLLLSRGKSPRPLSWQLQSTDFQLFIITLLASIP